jgi:signal transduction histidine kinase
VNLRGYWALYLITLHVVVMGVVARLFWNDYRPWIILIELFLAVTLATGLWLTSQQSRYEELTEIGEEFLREGDFSHLFVNSIHPDVNRFIQLYNRMIVTLREERLLSREQEKLLDQVVKSTPNGLITLDSEGTIEMVNPACVEMLGFPEKDLVGRRFTYFDTELTSKLASLRINQSMMLSVPGPRRIRVEHVEYFRESVSRSLFILTDLTQDLWASERRVYEQVIRTFSHEVNNTVGATNSILKSLLDFSDQIREGDRGDYENVLNVAIDRMDSLNSFMKGYTEIIKLPAPVREPVDLIAILNDLHTSFQPECRERNIQLELTYQRAVPQVMLDPTQFERAMMNILRNAIEAVSRDGKVILRVEKRPDGAVALTVEDDGPGIGQDVQSNLFTPFTSTKESGQGLGLVLVKEILTKHGFRFSLKTEPDGWTRFLVTMPLSAEVDT